MHTENKSAGIALFLFAHQDDEFAIFQKILDEKKRNREIICIYFTDGASKSVSPATRNAESSRVLTYFGISPINIIFLGDVLEIADSQLPYHLEKVANWLLSYLKENPAISTIYVPAWEGGHQDHDALHAITISVAIKLELFKEVWQFSLYNNFKCVGPFFNVLHPLAENGPVIRAPISFGNKIFFLRLCLLYPSQRSSWIGLFPFIFLHYFFNGYQTIQPINYSRIEERPHNGTLYYECRNFFTWKEMLKLLGIFLRR